MARRGENIYKRKDGRYEGRYVIGKTKDGRTKFGYIYGRQYITVHNALIKMKASQLQNSKESCPRINLSQWMEDWLEKEQKTRIKASSYHTYLNIYKKHIKPHIGNFPIYQLAPGNVQEFLDILASEGLAARTVRGIFRLLHSALRSAQEEGLITKNPCRRIKLQDNGYKDQPVLNLKEQKVIHEHAVAVHDLPSLLGLYTGMRLGEICALKWTDIDWHRKSITVRRTVQRISSASYNEKKTALFVGSPKSVSSYRTLPVPDFLLGYLRDFKINNPTIYLFGRGETPADPRTIQRRFQRMTKACAISHVHFHTLRHTYATRLLEIGIDAKTVSTLLGHSSIHTTLDFYAHVTSDCQRKAIAKLVRIVQQF